MTYEDLRPTLDTGDIVLFAGKGGISASIKWFTRSRWSHVGMVVFLREMELLAVWEATTLCNIADVLTGVATKGVQLVPLSERLRRYPGEIAIRRLVELAALRQALRGRPYERRVLDLVRAAYDGWAGANAENLSSLFCSELVAEAYQTMGLLPPDPPSSEYTPHDWSTDRLPLPANYRLGDAICLDLSPPIASPTPDSQPAPESPAP